MFETILVPIDGSELADRIIGQVGRLLRREDSRVVLVTVVPQDRIEAREGFENPVEAARNHIERLTRELVTQGANVATRVLAGDPAARILECAADEKASLIAMATHGRSGLSRFVRGSVAERVLREADIPVLMANPRGLDRTLDVRIRKILVPLDGSERSASILPWASEIARRHDSELVLFHAVDPSTIKAPAPSMPGELARADERLGRHGPTISDVRFSQRTVWGPPAESILQAVDSEGADLLAMTTHGRSGVTRWAFGSVAEKVLREVGCPILIQRGPR